MKKIQFTIVWAKAHFPSAFELALFELTKTAIDFKILHAIIILTKKREECTNEQETHYFNTTCGNNVI